MSADEEIMLRYRNDATAVAWRSGVEYAVSVEDLDEETFQEARAFNESVPGMAGAAVQNADGEVLFIHHEDYGGWVMPGGRVEDGESFPEAARREVAEESGVDARIVRPLCVSHFVFRCDGASTDNFLVIYEGRAIDPETADELGEADEAITDVQWTATVPEGVTPDEDVKKTIRRVADRLDTLSWPAGE